MNEIYRADGIFIVSPVNWYQVTSPIKLMMDRMVCADGGNPDPTSTHGKDAETAKKIELDGWNYPRHLMAACSRWSRTATLKGWKMSDAPYWTGSSS